MGRPKLWRTIAALLLAGSLALPAAAQMANLPSEVRSAIAAMGPLIDSSIIARSDAMMHALQAPRDDVPVILNLAYGEDRLQTLDLYAPRPGATGAVPIVVFVHGGGYTGGDKRTTGNVGAYFARHGLLCLSINHRLAPAVTWPAQSVDIGSVVAWAHANAARYGGDPSRIIVIGHSSSASVVASYVLDQSIPTTRDGVRGAVLVSGGFGYRGVVTAYYGDDPAAAAERQAKAHVGESRLPLLLVTAEFDPPSNGAATLALAGAVCMRDGKCPALLWLGGHNHMTEIGSLDTADDRLGRAILDFLAAAAP